MKCHERSQHFAIESGFATSSVLSLNEQKNNASFYQKEAAAVFNTLSVLQAMHFKVTQGTEVFITGMISLRCCSQVESTDEGCRKNILNYSRKESQPTITFVFLVLVR
jgi:hypothetical protein